MNKIIRTNPGNVTALIARLALGIVVFPHGAQKLLGWFGGYGFNGTIGFLTGGAGLPYIIALLVIIIEFFGALFIIFGFLTRLAAFGILCNFIGVVVTTHIHNGFFMNWAKQANKGEGLEFFILLLALAVICLYTGGGKASTDAAITTNENKRHSNS
jgi:putative oxidoreductase